MLAQEDVSELFLDARAGSLLQFPSQGIVTGDFRVDPWRINLPTL